MMRTEARLRGSALILALLFSAGCTAARAYREAEREAAAQHWDMAVMGYDKALRLDPENGSYKLALARARQRAAFAHYERGKLNRASGQLDMALIELEQSVSLDPTNDSAQQELKRIRADYETRRIEIQGGTPIEKAKAGAKGKRAAPPMLNPTSNEPIQVQFQDQGIKKIYQALAAAAGINIIFDPQLKDDKFSIDLRGMSFQKALETAMRQAGHFYKVIDEKTVLIAQDTNQNRKEYEDLVIRTFFLSNGDVKDVSAMVRSILDLRRLGTIQQLNAIVIRDTADKVAVAEKIIEINDKAKAEVVVDVELIQINTSRALELGTELSSYSTTGQFTGSLPGPGGSTAGVIAALPWSQLFDLSIKDFSFTIPTITFNFVKNNTDAEVLAKPQLRIAEGEKAQLTIGDRVPIPVTTFNTQTAGQVGVVQPITSFQYQDVGIKIDIEPRVHHNREVTLKLTVEVSNLQKVPAGAQPIIGTRTITSTIRLRDGESNILAGLIRTDKTKAKTSIPFLGDIPLIGALFGNTEDSSSRTDLLLTLTPHIVRAPQITEEDMTPIWVGTENNVSFSGLNTRLESPNATGSPFDLPQGEIRPPGKAAAPGGPAAPSFSVPQGGVPNDPFKSPAQKQPPAGTTGEGVKPRNLVMQDEGKVLHEADPRGGPVLALSPSTEAIRSGESATVSLSSLTSLSDATALELTIEWDPTVVEVTRIAEGPWKRAGDGSVRFDSDHAPGRARLSLSKPEGGLPDGLLGTLQVRGLMPGTTVFRVSAGSSTGRGGPGGAPRAEMAALTVN